MRNSPRAALAAILLALAAAPAAAVAPTPARDPVPLRLPEWRPAGAAARAAFQATPEWRELLAESLPTDPRVLLDARTGRPGFVRLAVPLLPGPGNDLAERDPGLALRYADKPEATARERAAELLAWHADVLGIDARDLDLDGAYVAVLFDGLLASIEAPYRPHGIPVHAGTAYLRVSAGNVVELGGQNLRGAGDLDPLVTVSAATALDKALARLPADGEVLDRGSLRWLPRDEEGRLEYRLAWRSLTHAHGGLEAWEAFVDARTGELLALHDVALHACPGPPQREQVIGGVKTHHVFEPEEVRGIPYSRVTIGPTTINPNFAGLYDWPGGAGTASLNGPNGNVNCQNCTNPTVNRATLDAGGNADFGTGGSDRTGNGVSLVSERTTFYHVNRVKEFSQKWISPSNLPGALNLNVNNATITCNGLYNGVAIVLFVAGGGCVNTGELPGVIQHEWGHGLDERNGTLFGDWGEGCADALDWHTNRESGTARGFYTPGTAGLREMDEALAPLKAWPAPECGGETHCLGEVYGQAAWHLGRLLRQDARFGEEGGWHLSESLYFGASAQAAAIGPDQPGSVYEAYATVLDSLFGDGNLGNGVPLASLLNAAFSHHGMASASPYAESAYPCAAPPQAEVPSIQYEPRNATTGRPRVTLSWTSAFGSVEHDVLRSEDGASYGKLELAVAPAGTNTYVDDGVHLGQTLHYALQPHAANRCLARMDNLVVVPVHPGLGLEDAVVDEAGNGTWSPGEQVAVRPVVRNLTGTVFPPATNATAVTALLLPGDPRITIVQGTAALGAIAGTLTGTGATWTVRASNDPALCGQLLEFPVRLESNEGCWDATWSVVVGAGGAGYEVAGTRLGDAPPDANGNGTLEPGETFELFPALRSLDPAGASGVTATLASTDPNVSILDASASWGNLPAGTPVEPTGDPFGVKLLAGATCGARVPFTLQVLDAASCVPVTLAFELVARTGDILLVDASFDVDDGGFSASATAVSGHWQRTDPLPLTSGGGAPIAPDDDASPSPGRLAMVTSALTSTAGEDDVDGGCVSLVSPLVFTFGQPGVRLEYARWFGWAAEPAAGAVPDELLVEASEDGFLWREVERLTAPAASWTSRVVDLDTVFPAPPFAVQARFTACDHDADSLVEAAVDDVRVVGSQCAAPTPDASVFPLWWTYLDGAGGDGDSIVEPGETVDVLVQLANQGLGDALNVRGTLSLRSAVAGLSLGVVDATWPDLAPGASEDNLAAFTLSLDAAAFPCGSDLPLQLDFAWDPEPGGSAGSGQFPEDAPTSPRIAGTVDETFAFDDFEGAGALGWRHVAERTEDDWQIGAVAGAAGDPAAAFSGTRVLGTDLGLPDASIAWDGAAAPNALRRAETDPVDLADFAEVRLRFQRWLTVEDGAREHARILVNGSVAWENPPGADLVDAAWTPVEIDLTPLAAGRRVVLAFELETDGGAARGGWNVDDVEIVGKRFVPDCGCRDRLPDPLTSELRVRKAAGRAELDWSQFGGYASSYRVYSSDDPSLLSAPISLPPEADLVPGPTWQPPSATTPLACWVVKARNDCGEE